MNSEPCTHLPDNPIRVLWIPTDVRKDIEFTWIGNSLQAMQNLVGGPLEIVPQAPMRYSLPKLDCGCNSVLVVNEDGHMTPNRANPRASYYYPGIVGNAFIVGEGLLRKINGRGDDEMVFLSLSEDYGLKLIQATS